MNQNNLQNSILSRRMNLSEFCNINWTLAIINKGSPFKSLNNSFKINTIFDFLTNFIILYLNLIQKSNMEADPTDDILGPKRRNYQFLQLVRDKKYPQALILGKIILKQNPNNPSVAKFVEFIQHNAKKLDNMVQEEEQYESVHSSDESEQEQGDEEQQQGQDKEESQKQSESQKEEQEEEEQEKPQKKVELTTCTLNSIPHVCPRHHKLLIQAAQEGYINTVYIDCIIRKLGSFDFIIIKETMNLKPSQCYQTCNKTYAAMNPGRLFCKKGCDFEQSLQSEECRTQFCNKVCIKEEQGDQKLWFKFLYRAPSDPTECLNACIFGCNTRQ